jgi:rhodanese-related sulfurtransferase
LGLHPGHHAGYCPGATPIHLKLIYSPEDGRILGAQAVGKEGIDKRIDVIATMIQMRGTVHDLAEVELCYAPQFGAAKDPVNVAGMKAANALRGDMPLADWREIGRTGAVLLDVREPDEFEQGHVDGAINLPLSELRRRIHEVPRDRELWVCCAAGQRAYYAQRLLMQRGLHVKNLSGGFTTYRMMREAGLLR